MPHPAIEGRTVRVIDKDIDEVRAWCTNSYPPEKIPELSAHETPNGLWVIRATFEDQKDAALFRLFWDN